MRLLRVLLDALVEVLVVPIRDGHPRPRSWAPGVAPVMVVAAIGYLIALVLLLAAPLLVDVERLVIIDGAQVIGSGTQTVLIWLVGLVLALGLTAVLHIAPLLRVVGLVLLLMPLVLLVSVPDRGLVAGLGMLGIIVFFVVRVRARFAGWEFAVLWVLVSLTLLVPLQWDVNHGYDQRTVLTQLVLLTMSSLAVPALMMGGYAASQIAVSWSQWVGFRTVEHARRLPVVISSAVLAVGYLALAIWRSIDGAPGWAPSAWIGSLLVVVLASAVVLAMRAALPVTGRHRADPTEPDELVTAWRRPAYLMALVMLAPMLLSIITATAGAIVGTIAGSTPDWLATLGANNTLLVVVRAGQAIIAGRLGWRRARLGDQVAPVVLGSYSAVMALSAAAVVTGWRLFSWELGPVSALLLLLMLAMMIASDGEHGLHHLLVVSLLVWVYGVREVLSDPSAVFVAAPVAAVLLGSLLWRLLTDGELTRGDSPGFPAASRVLGWAAMSLLALVSLAVSAQIRLQGSPLDQAPMMAFGDRTLGGALFLAAGIASLLGFAQSSLRVRSRGLSR